MSIKQLALAFALAGSVALPACDLDIPDLNNPGLEQLENNPTTASINTAATGLLVGARGGKSAPVGLVNMLGILGREAYDFDSADPRFVTELVQGNLSKGSPFGGSFWGGPYANIRLANIILNGLDKVSEYTDANKAAIRGYVNTIIAFELFTVIITHDKTGAVIDTDRPIDDLGPFVSKDAVFDEIDRLLDEANTDLAAGGAAFTFPLSAGFAGFNTPMNFAKFNRALRARTALYQTDYAVALTALQGSFINDTIAAPVAADFAVGTFHVYSTAAGDQTNGLIRPSIFAHPSFTTDVVKAADGVTPADARYTAKINPQAGTTTSTSDAALKSNIKFKIYTNIAPVPIIRNEELILIKAEALWFTGNKTGAMTALNYVRTNSGKLPAIATEPATDAAFIDALLYERRYSLMYEGGHRWIDLRRFGRALPLDAGTHTQNLRYPVPQGECDARPGEPACNVTSSEP